MNFENKHNIRVIIIIAVISAFKSNFFGRLSSTTEGLKRNLGLPAQPKPGIGVTCTPYRLRPCGARPAGVQRRRPHAAAMDSSPEAIVTIISRLLTDLVARNDLVTPEPSESNPAPSPQVWRARLTRARRARSQLPLPPEHVTPFHSSKPPAISVKCYLEDR